MARSISKSLRPGLPPCDGICRIPSSALCVRLLRHCAASLLQAFLSPIFGAPLAPVPWQAPHTVATTSLPLLASPAAIACGSIIHSTIAATMAPGNSQRVIRISDEALSKRPFSLLSIASSSGALALIQLYARKPVQRLDADQDHAGRNVRRIGSGYVTRSAVHDGHCGKG